MIRELGGWASLDGMPTDVALAYLISLILTQPPANPG